MVCVLHADPATLLRPFSVRREAFVRLSMACAQDKVRSASLPSCWDSVSPPCTGGWEPGALERSRSQEIIGSHSLAFLLHFKQDRFLSPRGPASIVPKRPPRSASSLLAGGKVGAKFCHLSVMEHSPLSPGGLSKTDTPQRLLSDSRASVSEPQDSCASAEEVSPEPPEGRPCSRPGPLSRRKILPCSSESRRQIPHEDITCSSSVHSAEGTASLPGAATSVPCAGLPSEKPAFEGPLSCLSWDSQ